MLQMFAGIVVLIFTCFLASAFGSAMSQVTPTKIVYNRTDAKIYFMATIIGMIAAGLLLGYK